MIWHLSLARPVRLTAAAFVASACDAQPRGTPAYQARDSSGIQIHEYDQAAFSAAPQWTVSATPVLDIGSGVENDPRYEFFRIEAMDRFGNGDFVVLTSGTNEIRVYDSAGRYVRDIGRVGSGPGEFVAPRWLQVMDGDSLFVFDFNQHRLTIFDPGGEPGRTVRVGPLSFEYTPAVRLLGDHSFLVRAETRAPRSPAGDGELSRDSVTYRRFTTEGAELTPLGPYPGREIFWQSDGPRRMLLEPLGFGRSFELVAGDSLVYLGQTDSYEIRAYTHAGYLRQILRVNLDPVPVTNTMIAAFKEHKIERYGDSAIIAGFRRVREAMPYPATTPAFSQLAIDSGQNLWIRSYPAYPESSTIWHIFSPAGRLSGRVELPASFEPRIFEDSVVTGVWTDDDEVEHLRSYRIERQSRQ